MSAMVLTFSSVFLLSLLFIGIIRHYAATIGLVDIPNERSAHQHVTPRGAGIAFYLAVMVVFLLFDYPFARQYALSLLATFLVFGIGTVDDLWGTSPRSKFIVLFFAVILLYFDKIVITDIGTYFGIHIPLGWFALPFTLFAALTFTNALNLIDGLDGLAATISIVILAGFFAIGYLHQDSFMMLFAGGYLAALAAFLFYNWHPASIFMGDSGSLILGFVITIVAVKSLEYIPAVDILYLAALPIIDTTVAVIRRKRTGRGIFAADSCHLHHVLSSYFGHDTRKSVLLLAMTQLLYTLTGLWLAAKYDGGILLLLFLLNLFIVYVAVTALIKRQGRICGKPKALHY